MPAELRRRPTPAADGTAKRLERSITIDYPGKPAALKQVRRAGLSETIGMYAVPIISSFLLRFVIEVSPSLWHAGNTVRTIQVPYNVHLFAAGQADGDRRFRRPKLNEKRDVAFTIVIEVAFGDRRVAATASRRLEYFLADRIKMPTRRSGGNPLAALAFRHIAGGMRSQGDE